jgi:5-methyltetrahydrofolate--homocysteine methyltransferase
MVSIVKNIANESLRVPFLKSVADEQAKLRKFYEESKVPKLSLDEARERAFKLNTSLITKPKHQGVFVYHDLDASEYLDWDMFLRSFGFNPVMSKNEKIEAEKLLCDAKEIQLKGESVARLGIFPANRVVDDIEIYSNESRNEVIAKLCTIRQQQGDCTLALADFIAERGTPDYIGAFALTAGTVAVTGDDYHTLLFKIFANCMAEALAEKLHSIVRNDIWGAEGGIRPASGYPTCPDHSDKAFLFKLLGVQEISLTENYAMTPEASIAGWFFMHPEARYFDVGRPTDEQLLDYASRKGQSLETVRHNLGILL